VILQEPFASSHTVTTVKPFQAHYSRQPREQIPTEDKQNTMMHTGGMTCCTCDKSMRFCRGSSCRILPHLHCTLADLNPGLPTPDRPRLMQQIGLVLLTNGQTTAAKHLREFACAATTLQLQVTNCSLKALYMLCNNSLACMIAYAVQARGTGCHTTDHAHAALQQYFVQT
jgi:hypothetical protein